MGDPILQIPGPPKPTAPQLPADIGLANKGAQVVAGITGALQGLKSAHQEMAVGKWDEAQRAYMAAKVNADALQRHLDALGPGDDEYAAAKSARDEAVDNLAQNTKSLMDMAGGGGKGKNAQANPKSAQHQSVLGKILQQAYQRATGQPKSPTSTPGFSPVPKPPGAATGGPVAAAAPLGQAAPSFQIPNAAGNLTA